MSDKIALSVVMLFIEGMAQISEQNTENDPLEASALPDSTAVSGDVSATEMPSGLPSPLAEINAGVPAHLRDLTDRARTYVEAASSAFSSAT